MILLHRLLTSVRPWERSKFDALNERISGMELKVCSIERVIVKFDCLESRMKQFEEELSGIGVMRGTVDYIVALVDDLAAQQHIVN